MGISTPPQNLRLFYLAPMLCVGALNCGLPPPFSVQEAPPSDMHFQPLAGNEMKKGLWLKLTPMWAMPTLRNKQIDNLCKFWEYNLRQSGKVLVDSKI